MKKEYFHSNGSSDTRLGEYINHLAHVMDYGFFLCSPRSFADVYDDDNILQARAYMQLLAWKKVMVMTEERIRMWNDTTRIFFKKYSGSLTLYMEDEGCNIFDDLWFDCPDLVQDCTEEELTLLCDFLNKENSDGDHNVAETFRNVVRCVRAMCNELRYVMENRLQWSDNRPLLRRLNRNARHLLALELDKVGTTPLF